MTVLTSLTGTQNYFDGDGLLRKYGTDKASANRGGEYKTYGPTRELEFTINLVDLTTTAQIVSETVFFPPVNCFIESAYLDVSVVGVSGGSGTVSIGVVKSSTRDSADATDAALLSAEVFSGVFDTVGRTVYYDASGGQGYGSATFSTHKGSAIGTALSGTSSYLITAKVSSTYSSGQIRFRVRYKNLV